MNSAGNRLKILFLGQCLQYGYEGLTRYETFPNHAAMILRAQFPSLDLKFELKYLHHPTGLKAILKHRLLLTKPDIALISLPAMFAATTWRVNLIYQIAPEVVDTARSFKRSVEARAKGASASFAAMGKLFDKAYAVQPPLGLDHYEQLVEEALMSCSQTASCRFVLMGPGRFNDDTCEDYPIHSPELWSSVNQMILRLGQRWSIPVVNTQELLTGHGGEVFINNNHRFSRFGHEVVGREVATVLASQIAILNLEGAGARA
ncbi:MAG: hypothetical protein AABN34_01900 [Acidobacteriota bacterium]